MIKKLETAIDYFSRYTLVLCVFFMLFLTLGNITMRWFQYSIHWIDPLVHHLVFLSAFLGGTLAVASRHHIKIDLLSRFLEKSKNKIWSHYIDILITSVCVAVTIMLVKAGYDAAVSEFEYGRAEFLGIHSGYLMSIIPFGMGLISLRFLLRLFSTSFK